MGRVFANIPGDLDSIPGRVIPKTLKMVLDTSLLNTQQQKVRIKGKVYIYIYIYGVFRDILFDTSSILFPCFIKRLYFSGFVKHGGKLYIHF